MHLTIGYLIVGILVSIFLSWYYSGERAYPLPVLNFVLATLIWPLVLVSTIVISIVDGDYKRFKN